MVHVPGFAEGAEPTSGLLLHPLAMRLILGIDPDSPLSGRAAKVAQLMGKRAPRKAPQPAAGAKIWGVFDHLSAKRSAKGAQKVQKRPKLSRRRRAHIRGPRQVLQPGHILM